MVFEHVLASCMKACIFAMSSVVFIFAMLEFLLFKGFVGTALLCTLFAGFFLLMGFMWLQYLSSYKNAPLFGTLWLSITVLGAVSSVLLILGSHRLVTLEGFNAGGVDASFTHVVNTLYSGIVYPAWALIMYSVVVGLFAFFNDPAKGD